MAILFKRSNGMYYILYEDNGKRKWKSTGQTQQAAALNTLLHFDGSPQTERLSATLSTFSKDFLSYAKVTFAPRTFEIYKSVLAQTLRLLGDRPLGSFTPRDADMYRVQRLSKISPVSVNIELRTLRAAFSTATRWKLIDDNPWRKVSLVRIPERFPVHFSREDFSRLISLIREAWLKDLVIVGVFSGLRRGELLNLTWNNVDFENRLLNVQSSESFKTKAGKKRFVPMNDVVYRLLRSKAQTMFGELVFNRRGSLIEGKHVTRRFREYVRAAGLDRKLHFHSLRHTFATWLVREGVSTFEVQKLLGHSNISVTQVYAHLATPELHRAVSKIQFALN